MKKLFTLIALASPVSASAIVINHDDVMNDLTDIMIEDQIEFKNQFDICLWQDESSAWDCERFNDHTSSAFVSSIYMHKKKRGDPKSPGGRTGVKTALKGIRAILSAGARVKIKSLKMNADGSWEMHGLDIVAGVGEGVPTPGFEDGKQVNIK